MCVSCHIELESLELQSRAHTLICVYVFIYRKSTSPWTERCSISYFSKISRLLLRTCALYTKRFIYNTLAHQHNLRCFVARYSCSRRCRCYCGKLDNHFLLSWCSLRADFVGCFVVVYSIRASAFTMHRFIHCNSFPTHFQIFHCYYHVMLRHSVVFFTHIFFIPTIIFHPFPFFWGENALFRNDRFSFDFKLFSFFSLSSK